MSISPEKKKPDSGAESAPEASGDSLDRIARFLYQDILDVEDEIQKNLVSQVPSVTQIARHIVMSGGKRLRPILCVLAAKALGYSGPRIISMGTAIEFIHTATLLHDDVIDNAQLRRGRPSCNAIWDNKMSVLVGDFLYCQASSLIARDGDLRILKSITDATANTTEGEVLEITKSRDLKLGESEYFKIVEFKTGVLMSCACQVGAIIAQASPEIEAGLRTYGMHLGIAFQLADDVLDYISVESEFGKAKGVDLKEGKMTLPLLYALERCTSAEREIIWEGTISARPDIFLQVLDVLNKYGAVEYVLGLASERTKLAKDALGGLPVNPYSQALLKLTDYVIERKK